MRTILSIVALGLAALCGPLEAEAGILGRVGVRDAAVASYTAAKHVDELTARLDQLTSLLDEVLTAFRRQGFVEVEVRHCEWSLFSIRVYLPEADMQGMAGQGWARRGQAGQGEAGQGKANFLEDPGSRK